MTTGRRAKSNGKAEPTGPRAAVALASPPGTAAIGVIQLAGTKAPEILTRHLETTRLPQLGQIRLTYLRDLEGQRIDQVLVTCVCDCQPIYELTCHGGMRVIQRIIEVLCGSGAQLVDAQLLTGRVYRLDNPVARDAYRLLPHARTRLVVKFLLHQAQTGLAELYGRVEAGTVTKDELADALKYWPAVGGLISGVTVVIVGPANAGKSTLLNFLAAHERALVADIPGTTRDYVQAEIELDGLATTLIDTAGLGSTADVLAGPAREKTIQACETAHLALIVLDAVNPRGLQDQLADAAELTAISRLVDKRKAIVLLNKIDHADRAHQLNELVGPTETVPKLEISALKGTNADKLSPIIWQLAGLSEFDYRRPTVFTAAQAEFIKTTSH